MQACAVCLRDNLFYRGVEHRCQVNDIQCPKFTVLLGSSPDMCGAGKQCGSLWQSVHFNIEAHAYLDAEECLLCRCLLLCTALMLLRRVCCKPTSCCPPPAVLHQLLSPAGGKCAVEMHVVHKVARFLCCLTLDMSGFMSGTSSVHLVSVWQVPAAVSCTPGKCGDGSTVC